MEVVAVLVVEMWLWHFKDQDKVMIRIRIWKGMKNRLEIVVIMQTTMILLQRLRYMVGLL